MEHDPAARPGEASAPFGLLLKSARRRAGLSQEELGRAAGFSASGIRKLEAGDRSPAKTTLELLAAALDLDAVSKGRLVAAALTGPNGRRLPQGARFGTLPPTPTVGRDVLLTRIIPLVESAASGAGQLIVLSGGRGVGKTRLGQEATKALLDMGFVILAATCAEGRLPLDPFRTIMEMLAENGPAVHAQRAHSVAEALSPPALGRQEIPGEAADPAHVFRRVAAVIKRALANVPLAILVDDIHHADREAIRLLSQLAMEAAGWPLLLLSCYSTDDLTPANQLHQVLGDLDRNGSITRIDVDLLDRDAVSKLISLRASDHRELNHDRVSEHLAALMHDRWAGNSFDTIASIDELIKGRRLTVDRGELHHQGDDAVSMPKRTHDVLIAQLARLTPETLAVLQAASVFGQEFNADVVTCMLNQDEPSTHFAREDVERALGDACTRRIVGFEEHPAHPPRYAFTHQNYREVLYRDLTPEERRRMHLMAGNALECVRSTAGVRASELAHHYGMGGNERKHLAYLIPAGHEARSVAAHREAAGWYRQALELARRLPYQQDAQRTALAGLGMALSDAGPEGLREGLACLHQAARLCLEDGDRDGYCRALAHLGWIHRELGTPDEGLSLLEPALREVLEFPSSAGLVMLHVTLFSLYFVASRFHESLLAAERAARVAGSLPDAKDRRELGAYAEVRRGFALQAAGRHDEALSVLRAARASALACDMTGTAGRAAYNEAVVQARLGCFEAARGLYVLARTLDEEVGDNSAVAWDEYEVAVLDLYQGRWQSARRRFRQVSLMPETPPRLAEFLDMYVSAMAGFSARTQNERKAATARLENIRRAAREVGNRHMGMTVTMWLAWLDLVHSCPEAALERIELCDRHEGQGGNHEVYRLTMLSLEAWAAAQLGHTGRALRLSAEAVRGARHHGTWQNRRMSLLARAVALRNAGRVEASLMRAQQARAFSTDLECPLMDAYVHRHLGRLYGQMGRLSEATAHYESAEECFAGLGMKGQSERTRAEKEHLAAQPRLHIVDKTQPGAARGATRGGKLTGS